MDDFDSVEPVADGITDYWYLVHSGSEPEKQGWVFGSSIEFNGE